VGRLTIWNTVGSLLQLDDLLVGECTAIVDKFKRVLLIAGRTRADRWFGNPSPINVDLQTMMTSLTTEKGYEAG
jgi:hypothetical protein